MLKKAEADLVIVSSYSFSHTPVAIEALETGHPVLVEKPIAMNTAWFDRLISARDASGKRVFPFHNYRYFPEYRYLRRIIDEKAIGDVFEIRCRLLGFSRRNDWQTLREYGGGVLNNTCPHFIDLLLQMVGAPVDEFFTDLKLVTNVGDAENHVRIIMRGKNGRTADLLVSSIDAFPEPKWTVLGSRGTLISDGKTAQIKYFDKGDLPPYRVKRGPSPNRSYDFGGKIDFKERTETINESIPHDLHDNIYMVLQEGGKQDIMLEDVHEVVRITEAARKKDGFYGDLSRKMNPEA
jgi:predicted dehydrogenase